MSSRNSNYWPSIGMCAVIVGTVGFWYGLVFFAAKCGYPVVALMLVVVSIVTVVCCLVSINWEAIKNWVKSYVPGGVGIGLTCIALSNMIQELIAHPSVLVAILFACLCLSLSYRSFFPRKS